MLTLWRTTVGKKFVMAVTGVMLVGFVFVHMLGNMKIYYGEAKFNAYAAWLREVGSPVLGHEQFLWIARAGLLVAVALHLTAALQLTLQGLAARPVAYASKENIETTYAARTMRFGGVILALFIVYHILHFTLGCVGFSAGQFQHTSPYRNVIAGFSVWYVSAFYAAAMAMLGLHLYHGIWSLFQTLGVRNIRSCGAYRGVAAAISLLVSVANVSIPVSVILGILR